MVIAKDRPFVRIMEPVDASALTPDTDFDLRGIFDHQSVEDASKFQVHIRLYQGVVNRLALIQKTTARIESVAGEAGLYAFHAKLELPTGRADCVLRIEVFERVVDQPKWVARDFVILHPRRNDEPMATASEPLPVKQSRDRRVLMGNDLDGARFDTGAVMSPTGFLTLNGAGIPAKCEARVRLYRVQGGQLTVHEEGRATPQPSTGHDGMQFDYSSRPKQARPSGDYLLRFDIIDPEKPDVSLLRDATLLEIVPRKPVQKPEAS
jgi:hypothetical protein